MDPNERHDPHAHHAHRHEHAHAGHPPPAAPAVANTAPPADDDDAAAVTIYTCPMHPQIRQDHPGHCPICGMTLEPVLPQLGDEEDPELRDLQRRFWWTLPLTLVEVVLAMAGHGLGGIDRGAQGWIELALSLPVVLWEIGRASCRERVYACV